MSNIDSELGQCTDVASMNATIQTVYWCSQLRHEYHDTCKTHCLVAKKINEKFDNDLIWMYYCYPNQKSIICIGPVSTLFSINLCTKFVPHYFWALNYWICCMLHSNKGLPLPKFLKLPTEFSIDIYIFILLVINLLMGSWMKMLY